MRKQYTLLTLLFLITASVSAQQKINGLVEDEETGEPVSYASVLPQKGEMIVTDSSGKFSMMMRRQPRPVDSISISAIGYLSKRIAIKDLLNNNKVQLRQEEKILDMVKIYASIKG